jgi:shikimate dehydrogenase
MNHSAHSTQPSSMTVGLIGWPVEHSRSPAMHNAAFAALKLNWHYILLPTPPDQLDAVIARIRAGGLQGANVTIPHKLAVLPFLDEIDMAARAVGAVNTIVRQGDRLIGYNTDTLGFKHALLQTGVAVKDQACVVLGAGGSARAVLYVLRELGAHITVYARDVEKAQVMLKRLAAQRLPAERHSEARSAEESLPLMGDTVDSRRDSSLPAKWAAQNDTIGRVAPLTQLGDVNPDTALIVNTTPVGLSPHVEASPWPADAPFPTNALIFDLLNNPPRTRLMQQAEQAGLRAVNGWNMLVYQGAAAFEKWTGMAPPVEVMKQALEQSLKAG